MSRYIEIYFAEDCFVLPYILTSLLTFLLSLLLALFQPGDFGRGLLAFLAVLLPGTLLLTALWQRAAEKRFLGALLTLALLARVGIGLGLYLALPLNGYPNPEDRAGYLFTDAYRRDHQAWELAQSTRPITDAFRARFYADQYGGLLALSALLYRYLSPDAHRPLLVVALVAWIAALGVLYAWRFMRALFVLPESPLILARQGWARHATLLFAFYPEALLLGASQMREPFLLTFGALFLWGMRPFFSHTRHRFSWEALVGLLGLLLISPGMALTLGLALLLWLWAEGGKRIPSWLWALLLGVAVLGALLFAFSVAGVSVTPGTPWAVIGEWSRLAVRWSAYQLERSSGWVQKIFREVPPALQMPFVLGYGILQPVLPAALVEPTTLTWKGIALARALGWYTLLPLLLFAVRAAWKSPAPERRRWLALWAICWIWIAIAALRGGADQWDNPRYRLWLLIFQAVLAAYAWGQRDRWLWRLVWIEGLAVLGFLQWYLSRYYHLGPRLSFYTLVGLIFALALLILLGGWWWERWRGERQGGFGRAGG